MARKVSKISRNAWEWLSERLGLDHLPLYRVPYSYFRLEFWLGAFVAASFTLLVITGLLLLFYYNPGDPIGSNMKLIEEKPFGRVILTTHLYAAHAMIFTAVIHLARNLIRGAYKFPRELVWVAGVLVGVMAIQTAFFGYSLVGDKISEEAISIGSGLVENSFGPYWGKVLVALAFDIEEASRYFRLLALHIIMAAIVGLLFMAHFGLFEAHGPQPDHKETNYSIEPAKIDQTRDDLAPWVPVNLLYGTALVFAVWGLIVFANALSQAAGFTHQLLFPLPVFDPDKLAAAGYDIPQWLEEALDKVRPMPPWFLVYSFKLFQLDFLYLNFLPNGYNAISIFFIAMILPPLLYILLPFIDRGKSTHPLDRPVPIILGGLLLIYLIQLTIWGAMTLGYYTVLTALLVFIVPALIVVPGFYMLRMAYKGEPVPPKYVLGLMGIVVLVLLLPLSLILRGSAGAPETFWGDVATMLFGLILALGYIAILGATIPSGEEEEETSEAVDPDKVIGPLTVATLLDLFIAVTAGIALILAVDPVKAPVLATGLLSAIFLGLFGLAHAAYRATTFDKLPPKGVVSELLPHIMIYILVAILLIATL